MNTGATDSGWYYSKLGAPPDQQVGPVSWQELLSLARTRILSPDDLVWNETLPAWQPAREVSGLFAATPPPPPGYRPPTPSSYGPGPRSDRSRLLMWLLPLIVVVAAGAGLGAYFGTRGHHDETSTATSTAAAATGQTAFTQAEGEIFCEASGSAGPDSFTGELFVAQGPTTTLSIPSPKLTLPPMTTTTAASASTTASASAASPTATTAAPPVVLASYPGDTPALYGGSKSKVVSDKEGELRFFEQNPLKAAAFCEALNSDPTLRWSGGTQVRPDQLRAYFAELTPMMLTRDIRVTNYGYRDGHPTPRQSVLQAGQLVLVDRYGVPRKRCECGNPLTPPRPVSRPPVYTGPKWPGFDPTTIIIIQQTTVIINTFVIIDIDTGDPFGRPSGSDGKDDGTPPSSTTSSTTSSTESSSASSASTEVPPSSETTGTSSTETTDGQTTTSVVASGQINVWKLEVMMRRSDSGSNREMSIEWGVEITINPDGSLTGTGQGSWHCDGAIYEGPTQTGTFSVEATFGVNVAGTAENDEGGRTLKIQQEMTEYQLENWVLNTTSDKAQAQAGVEAAASEWLKAAFTNLMLPAGTQAVYGAAEAGGYSGSANLLPVQAAR